ncbi:RsiV family protein [Mycolicibacterium helvum]
MWLRVYIELAVPGGLPTVVSHRAQSRASTSRRANIVKDLIHTSAAAALLGAVALGVASPAKAVPINDPLGLCANPVAGKCVWGTGHPRSNVDIEFPANTPLEQEVVDFATKTANDYYATEAPTRADPNPAGSSELRVTGTAYTSGTAPAGTETVVLKTVQNISGTAHPMTWYKAFPYNRATQAPITFDALFAPGVKPLDVILPIVNEQISTSSGEPFAADPAAGHDPANYQNFAVTDDAVIFFFDKDELRAATSDFQVSVPRSAIAPMLSPGI